MTEPPADRMGELRAKVLGGLGALEAAQQTAAADIAKALLSATQADLIATQTVTQRGQVAAWTPVATVAGMTQVRDQMLIILDRQTVIVQALADLYRYRAANDTDAALSHQASEFLARYMFWGQP